MCACKDKSECVMCTSACVREKERENAANDSVLDKREPNEHYPSLSSTQIAIIVAEIRQRLHSPFLLLCLYVGMRVCCIYAWKLYIYTNTDKQEPFSASDLRPHVNFI